MGLPLNRKYRPEDFDEMVGNGKAINSIKTKVKRGEIIAYLLHGARGTGKTTLARIMAKELGAVDRNVKEYDIGDTGGVAEARAIKESTRYSALGGGSKVYLLDEIQGASPKFFQAILKILEEPPKNVYFILCTTDPQKLPPAVRSRCADYQTRFLTKGEGFDFLTDILRKENDEGFPEVAIKKIVKAMEGNPREMLILLDKVIDIEEEDELLDAIDKFILDKTKVKDLVDAILKGKDWKIIKKMLDNFDEEPETVRYSVLGLITSAMLKGWSQRSLADLSEIGYYFERNFYDSKKFGLVNACLLASKVKGD